MGRDERPMWPHTTHILLLRHGQTDANAEGVLQGHLPTPLNLTGVRQATLLAGRVAAFRPRVTAVLSSDLPRATQTASPVATACRLRLATDPAWRERGFGLLEGKPVGTRETWRVASGEIDPPGAEPTADFFDRVRSALEHVPGRHRGHATVAVVTHGGPIRAVLKMVADGRLAAARGSKLDPSDLPTIANCSVLHLMARHYRAGTKWRVAAVNDVNHLGELATSRDAG